MNKINIKTANLNLIRVLDALLTEQNVSKAADKLFLTQPAISHALNRLREIYQDDLLIRSAKGMEMTDLAVSIAPEVHELMRQAETLFSRKEQFNPLTSSYCFQIGIVGEFADFAIITPLMCEIAKLKSSLSVNAFHLSDKLALQKLDSGEIDIILGRVINPPASIKSITLAKSDIACIVNKQHPLTQGKMTVERYVAFRHIHFSYHEKGNALTEIDSQLKKHNLKRKIALSIDIRTSLLGIIENTDFIATLASAHADMLVAQGSVAIVPCPLKLPEASAKIYWHKRSSTNPVIQWLRDIVVRVMSGH